MDELKRRLGLKSRRWKKPVRSQAEMNRIELRLEMLEEMREDTEEFPFQIVAANLPADGNPRAPEVEYYFKKHKWPSAWPTAKEVIGPRVFNMCYVPFEGSMGTKEALKYLDPIFSGYIDNTNEITSVSPMESVGTKGQANVIPVFKVSSPSCTKNPPAFSKAGRRTADYCPLESEHSHIIQQSLKGSEKGIIAVSYVWGTPPHRAEVIGHHGDGKPLIVKLGVEWSRIEFISLLCSLSKLGWLWLDQEAKARTEVSEEQILASIPSIFEKCRVVAIAWGTSCAFCERLIEELDGDKTTLKKVMETFDSVTGHINRCYQCMYWQPWGERLWPRQESIYAQDLQLLQLSAHSALRRAIATDSPLPKAQVTDHFQDDICDGGQILRNVVSIFRQKWGCDELYGVTSTRKTAASIYSRSSVQAIVTGIRLLLGVRVLCPGRKIDFEVTIQRLIAEPRSVTEPRDLVLAVWCDLTGYEVPPGAKHRELQFLLQDAWEQYTSITKRKPPGILYNGVIGRETPCMELATIKIDSEATDTRRAFGQHAMPNGILGTKATVNGGVSVTVLSQIDVMMVDSECNVTTATSRITDMLQAMLSKETAKEDMRRLYRLREEMVDWAPLQAVCNALVITSEGLDIPGEIDWQMRQVGGRAFEGATIQQTLDFMTLWMMRLPGHMYSVIDGRGKFISVRGSWTVGLARESGSYSLAFTEENGILLGVTVHGDKAAGDLRAVAVDPPELQKEWRKTKKSFQIELKT